MSGARAKALFSKENVLLAKLLFRKDDLVILLDFLRLSQSAPA